MQLAPFLAKYRVTHKAQASITDRVGEPELAFLESLGGSTFEGGLYRLYLPGQVQAATEILRAVFPEFAKRITVFGYDWLGRHFALDSGRVERGRKLLLLLEPGMGDALEIPDDVSDFHNQELVNNANDCLAVEFHKAWRERNPDDIPPDSCVGYRVPLLLGGTDTVDNLELTDLAAYLHLCAQIRQQVLHLPDGTRVSGAKIS